MKTKILLLGLTSLLLILAACSESNVANANSVKKSISEAEKTPIEKIAPITSTGEVENYKLDIRGAHAFIRFKVKHLGYSWLHGRFNDFDGSFTYNTGNPNNSSINVTIDTTSVDSNHAERG